MQRISVLIDPGRRVARTMITTGIRERGKYKQEYSGYIAFVVGGKLIQRRLHPMSFNLEFDSCTFITYQSQDYAIDLVCKPISGAFNPESLKV